MRKTVRALGLFAGGLDSRLAAELLVSCDLDVRCLYLDTGFGKKTYRDTNFPLRVRDVSADYFRNVVRRPRFGVGAGMNPCLDCRIYMLRRAAEVARDEPCDLIFTGDVLGQRPLEQSRSALLRIEREAGLEGKVLRPLSALLLPVTAAERDGRVDRDRMQRIHGRSRRAQLELARRLGLERFPTPSGGCCRLADRGFARKLRDWLAHNEGGDPTRDDLELLERGRHFRLSWNLKLVIGRDEEESRWLAARCEERWTGQTTDGRGAFAILEGEPGDDDLTAAASLIARYSRRDGAGEVDLLLKRAGLVRAVRTGPAPAAAIERWRI